MQAVTDFLGGRKFSLTIIIVVIALLNDALSLGFDNETIRNAILASIGFNVGNGLVKR